MPGFDGSGPFGQGPMTGRGMGYCNPAGYGPGRRVGYGRGFGPGRGRGRGFCAPGYGFGRFYPNRAWGAGYPYSTAVNWSATDEKKYLQDMAAYFQEELDAVREELKKIEGRQEQD